MRTRPSLDDRQTLGKVERRHQTLKNRIPLENDYLPGYLERQVAAFVEHYYHGRYHNSIDNLIPADVYFGRGQVILTEREKIKHQTIQQRRLRHQEAHPYTLHARRDDTEGRSVPLRQDADVSSRDP